MISNPSIINHSSFGNSKSSLQSPKSGDNALMKIQNSDIKKSLLKTKLEIEDFLKLNQNEIKLDNMENLENFDETANPKINPTKDSRGNKSTISKFKNQRNNEINNLIPQDQYHIQNDFDEKEIPNEFQAQINSDLHIDKSQKKALENNPEPCIDVCDHKISIIKINSNKFF